MDETPIRLAAAGDLHCAEHLRERIDRAFRDVQHEVDMILLAGDLTTQGEPEQALVLADACRDLEVPVIAVLGNHDYHAGRCVELKEILGEAGVLVLDRSHTVVEARGLDVGIVGCKGFIGGFPGAEITDFGESMLRALYRETGDEVAALELGLEAVAGCRHRIVLLHYAPIMETLIGEPERIWAFLGSGRLAEPIGAHRPDLVLHGHAHHGSPDGAIGEVPVRNVAVHVVGADFALLRCGTRSAAAKHSPDPPGSEQLQEAPPQDRATSRTSREHTLTPGPEV